MVQFNKHLIKDIGLQREVEDALPYAVVGGAWEASFEQAYDDDEYTALTHIVPAGHQLKVLFLRVWTQEANGAKFSILQTNPTATGQTGDTEAYPVVGSVPSGVRDYPMLEEAGAEVLHGNLRQPVHVMEGKVEFKVIHLPSPATDKRYGIVWWGVQKNPEPKR